MKPASEICYQIVLNFKMPHWKEIQTLRKPLFMGCLWQSDIVWLPNISHTMCFSKVQLIVDESLKCVVFLFVTTRLTFQALDAELPSCCRNRRSHRWVRYWHGWPSLMHAECKYDLCVMCVCVCACGMLSCVCNGFL